MGWQDVQHHYLDGDPAEAFDDVRVLANGTHRARTPKMCEVCDGLIAPGQMYQKTVLLAEGRFEIHQHHTDRGECEVARREAEEWRRQEEAAYGAAMEAQMVAELGA